MAASEPTSEQPHDGAGRPAAPGGAGSPAELRTLRPQGRRTMRKLLDAGVTVFAERGYHPARVDDIVRAARTSHGTFYLYFRDKEDLLRVLAHECAAAMTELVGRLGPLPPGEAGFAELRAWLREFLGVYRRHGPVVRAWLEEQASDPLLVSLGDEVFGEVAGTFAGLIRRSAGADGIDPAVASLAMVAMVERFTYHLLSRDLPLDEDDVLDTMTRLVHRGFLGGAGPEAGDVVAGLGTARRRRR